MILKQYSNKLVSSTSIAVIYFIICSLYIIFSDKFLLFFFEENISNEALSEMQSYKGVFFVLVSSILIYFALKKRDKKVKDYTAILKKNQKQYQDLFENMSHGVIYATPEGIVTSVNKSTLNILEISEKEMIGKSLFDPAWKSINRNGESLDLYEIPAKRAIISKKPVRNIIAGAINFKTGLYVWLKVNAIPEFRNDEEEPFRVCVTIDDITELKNYEEDLEASKTTINESLKKTIFNEFLLKEASKLAKIGAYELYFDNQKDYFSHELHNLFEFSINERFPIEKIPKLFTEESNTILQKGVDNCMEFGITMDEVLDLKMQDGRHLKFRAIIKPIYNENNKIIGRRGVLQDITEQKKAEEKIVRSEQRFKALVQEGYDLYAIINSKGTYTYMSPSSTKIAGIPPEEFIGKNAFEFIHTDDIENAQESLKKVATQDRVVMKHYRAKTNNNEYRWIETVLTNMLNNPAVNGIVINSRDITNEIEEKQHLKLLESVITHTNDAVIITEAQPVDEIGHKIIYVNEAFTKMTGYAAVEIIGKTPSILQGPKSDREELTKLTKAIENWEPCEVTTTNYKKNGEEFWTNFTVIPVADEKGTYTHWISIERDVTESKLAKEKLIEAKEEAEKSEYSIREAGRMAKIGYWAYDKEKDIISWSDEIHKIYGTNFEEEVPNLDVILSFYTEKSKKEIVEATIELATKGIPYELELNLINSKNENIWIRNLGQPVYNEKNEIVGRRGVSQNITLEKNAQLALLKAKEEAEKNQKTMNQASKLAKIGYWHQDLVNNTLTWSDYIYQLYKLKPGDDILQYDIAKSYFDIESQEKIYTANKRLEEHGIPYDLELRVVFSKNEELWIRNMVQPVFNEHKKIIGKRGVIRNITEEKNLIKLNKQVGSLAKIGIWELNLVEETIFWSEEVHLIHGTDAEKYTPKLDEAINFYRKDFHELIKSSIEKCISKGKSYDIEAVIVTVDKKELWVRVNLKAEFVNDVCTRIYGSIQNINERKQAEISVKESEAKFRTIFEIASLGIGQVNPSNGEIMLVNSYYENITGYSVDELLKMKFSELTHPDDVEKDLELFKKAARGEGNYNNEKRYIKKDGSIVWVRIHLAFIRDENGIPKRTVAICEDITNRKKVEQEKLRFQETLENSLNEIYIFDSETFKFQYINQSALLNLGYSKQEINNINPIIIKPEYTLSSFKQLVEPLKNKELEKIIFFTNHKRKDGSIYPVEIHLKIVEEANYKNFIAIVLDITERKKAEEDLISTSERLSLATTSANIGIWEWDVLNNQLIWDETMFKIFGVAKKDFNGSFENWLATVHPDDINEANEKVQNALKGLSKLDLQFRIIWPNKSIRYVKGDAIVVNDAVSGKPIKMIGTNIDITESKNAEQEIIEAKEQIEINEAKFKSYTEKSPVAIYTTNKDGDCNYVNETWLKISGFKYKDALKKGWLKAIHPEDLDFVNKNWYKSVASKGKWRYEYRFVNKKTKEVVWVEATAKELFNDKNEIIGYLGTNVNITDRKNAEEMYRLLADNTNDIIVLQDANADLKYISPAVENLLGYKQDELLNKKFIEVIHKDDMINIKEAFRNKLLKGLTIDAIIYRVCHKKGHFVWLETLVSPIIKDNKIVSIISTSRDISQWMSAKKEIEEYQSSLQKLTSEISMIEEKQKKEIAANIHDHLSQSLVISKMRISDLEKKPELNSIYKDLDFIKSHISNALENSRKITYELSPPVLYQLGIVDALDWYAEETENKYDIKFQFNSNVDTVKLSDVKSILIFRCVQEAVTNTIKYAEATSITLKLTKDKKAVDILITDNGKGFDTAVLNAGGNSSSGFGLFAVKERIRSMNGLLTITSEIKIGTKIKIYVPL